MSNPDLLSSSKLSNEQVDVHELSSEQVDAENLTIEVRKELDELAHQVIEDIKKSPDKYSKKESKEMLAL